MKGWEENMPRAKPVTLRTELTLEQRRERRKLRREKQREDNVKRAAKMHAARLKRRSKQRKTYSSALAIDFCGMLGLALLEWRDSF
jgi:hypothetical protein